MKKTFTKFLSLLLAVCCLFFISACKVETPEQHANSVSSASSQNSVPESSKSPSFSVSSASSSQASVAENDSSQPAEAADGSQQDNGEPAVSAPAASTDAGTQTQEPAPSSEAAQETPDPPVQAVSVSVSILCTEAVGNPSLKQGISLPTDGVIAQDFSVDFQEGDNVFFALQKTCGALGLAMDYSGSPKRQGYVTGIGGLYQKDCGNGSGWLYSVNGKFPNASCSDIQLKDGDRIVFQFKAT